MKPKFQKLAQISGNCIKFPKEIIKSSVPIKMFKTENHCKNPQVVDATDGTRQTRKRGLRTLKRTLSLRTLTRTLKRTLKEWGDLILGFYGIGNMSVLEQSVWFFELKLLFFRIETPSLKPDSLLNVFRD